MQKIKVYNTFHIVFKYLNFCLIYRINVIWFNFEIVKLTFENATSIKSGQRKYLLLLIRMTGKEISPPASPTYLKWDITRLFTIVIFCILYLVPVSWSFVMSNLLTSPSILISATFFFWSWAFFWYNNTDLTTSHRTYLE